MSLYLIEYYPLCKDKRGRKAVEDYQYPPFVDHSIRREPSFEHHYPGITSICRGRLFARRLEVDDIIVYLTRPGKYLGEKEPHYRVVAILQVIKKCHNHSDAAEWYTNNGLIIPTNCMVAGNQPLPYDHSVHSQVIAPMVEMEYYKRVMRNPVFLITKPLQVELNNPPIIHKNDLERITGFTPKGMRGTQNPRKNNIDLNHLKNLTDLF